MPNEASSRCTIRNSDGASPLSGSSSGSSFPPSSLSSLSSTTSMMLTSSDTRVSFGDRSFRAPVFFCFVPLDDAPRLPSRPLNVGSVPASATSRASSRSPVSSSGPPSSEVTSLTVPVSMWSAVGHGQGGEARPARTASRSGPPGRRASRMAIRVRVVVGWTRSSTRATAGACSRAGRRRSAWRRRRRAGVPGFVFVEQTSDRTQFSRNY